MADDRIDEVLRRLEALEEAMRTLEERGDDEHSHGHHCRCDCHHRGHGHGHGHGRDCGCHHHDRGRDRHDCGCREHDRDRDRDGFDERRIVDLIVGLVAEHVDTIVERQLTRFLVPSEPTGEPPADDS